MGNLSVHVNRSQSPSSGMRLKHMLSFKASLKSHPRPLDVRARLCWKMRNLNERLCAYLNRSLARAHSTAKLGLVKEILQKERAFEVLWFQVVGLSYLVGCREKALLQMKAWGDTRWHLLWCQSAAIPTCMASVALLGAQPCKALVLPKIRCFPRHHALWHADNDAAGLSAMGQWGTQPGQWSSPKASVFGICLVSLSEKGDSSKTVVRGRVKAPLSSAWALEAGEMGTAAPRRAGHNQPCAVPVWLLCHEPQLSLLAACNERVTHSSSGIQHLQWLISSGLSSSDLKQLIMANKGKHPYHKHCFGIYHLK